MISRLVARCPSCEKKIVLRITVAGGRQPFLFGCPYCHTELRAVLVAHLDKAFDFQSDDLSLVSNVEEDPQDLAVAINTDLPVHESLVGQLAADAYASAFINLASIVDPDDVEDITNRVHRMRDLREQAYPYLRRAGAAFANEDIANVQFILQRVPGAEVIDFAREDPVNILGSAITELYTPFEDSEARIKAAEEFARTIGEAHDQDEKALAEIYSDGATVMTEHRARVIDTSLRALDDPSSLIPAMWLEAIGDRVPLDEFRIMRDDFDVLKSLYQDVFELASRGLAFTSRFANLALRGDASAYVDGSRRTLHKALNKTTAFLREPWLADFPAAKTLHDKMKRHTRNDIGHRLVRYDFLSGDLVYDDGDRERYVHFLVDYLDAVRLSHHLLDVCEIYWYTEKMLPAP